MNGQIENMLQSAEGRYLTSKETASLTQYSDGLPGRLKASAEVEQREGLIVDEVLESVLSRYSDISQRYKEGERKAQRDLSLVLRYCVLAMVKDDRLFLRDNLLLWLKTILEGIGLSQEFVKDSYSSLLTTCEKQLSAEAFGLLEPYLKDCVEVLGERERAA
ncbi:MAG: hypothetical protein AAF851_13360 [Myxococcota bacterium]